MSCNNPTGLRDPNHIEMPSQKNNFSKDYHGQRSKRIQKFDGKDYSVNFSRIIVEETDRLTRSRTKSDPNFLLKDIFPIKGDSTQTQEQQRIKSNIPAPSDGESKMDEFSERNTRNTSETLININSKEKGSDNMPGKRDILLDSMGYHLENLKNNANVQMIAAEREVVEFNPTTDLDQLLEISIDPDKYISSLNQEEMVPAPELTSSRKEHTTKRYDTNYLVDQDFNPSLGKDSSQNLNDLQLVGQQPACLFSTNQFLDMVQNEQILPTEPCGSSGEQFSEEKLKPTEDFVQNFEKTISPKVPTIILKAEKVPTIENPDEIFCKDPLDAQKTSSKDQMLINSAQNSQENLKNEINVSCFREILEQDFKTEGSWELIPQYGDLKILTDEEALQNQSKPLATTDDLEAVEELVVQKNIQNHWKIPKLKLENTSYFTAKEKRSTRIWDPILLQSHISQEHPSKEDSLDSLKTEEISWAQKNTPLIWDHEYQKNNLFQTFDLSLSEEFMELPINSKNSVNAQKEYAQNSVVQKDTHPQENRWVASKTEPKMYEWSSTITSSTVKQETLPSAAKNMPSLTDDLTVFNNVSLFDTENTIDEILIDSGLPCFGQGKSSVFQGRQQPICESLLGPSKISPITEKIDCSSERSQEPDINIHPRYIQSLWDTPAEEFLKDTVDLTKPFSISGGSIERVLSPTLKYCQTTSKYPGIIIPPCESEIFLPIASHSMPLDNFEEPKYQIELVDSPPPLRNYRPPRIPEIILKPKSFERHQQQLFRSAMETNKQTTMCRPKRGRRTRAEMELYREEMARKKQNEKKTDMERYIPNYFNQMAEGRNHLSTETPFAESFPTLNNNKKLANQFSTSSQAGMFNSESSMRAETPFMASRMEEPYSYSSCSKQGQLKHQVSGSANIVNDQWNVPYSNHSEKRCSSSAMTVDDFQTAEHHQQLGQDLLRSAEVKETFEAKQQSYRRLNRSQMEISDTLEKPVQHMHHSLLHQAQDIHNSFQNVVKSLHSPQLHQSSQFSQKKFETNPAQKNYTPQLPQHFFSDQQNHPTHQLMSQNNRIDNSQLQEMAEKHHQFPPFQQYSPILQSQQSYQQLQPTHHQPPQPHENPQPQQVFSIPRPYFPYQRF